MAPTGGTTCGAQETCTRTTRTTIVMKTAAISLIVTPAVEIDQWFVDRRTDPGWARGREVLVIRLYECRLSTKTAMSAETMTAIQSSSSIPSPESTTSVKKNTIPRFNHLGVPRILVAATTLLKTLRERMIAKKLRPHQPLLQHPASRRQLNRLPWCIHALVCYRARVLTAANVFAVDNRRLHFLSHPLPRRCH
jgi:hypothetical protein